MVIQIFCLRRVIHPPVIPFITPIPWIAGMKGKLCYSMPLHWQKFHLEITETSYSHKAIDALLDRLEIYKYMQD